jgi:tripartite-type tricarboxylate transporter receptor subunit TctC
VSEAGVPGYEATIWLGVMAPAGTPPEIIGRLNAEIASIIARPAIANAWAKQGAVPMTLTPAAFAAFLQHDIDKWAKVVEQSGAKVQ